MGITVEGAGTEDRPLPDPRLVIGLVALLAVLGVAGWLVVDRFTGIDRRIELLIDEYNNAWNRGDGTAVRTLMTPTGTHVNQRGEPPVSGLALESLVASLHDEGFEGEYTGPMVVSQDGVYHLVVIPVELTSGDSVTYSGFSYFRIVEYDGELRISHEEFFK
jgi:hypothetical protein